MATGQDVQTIRIITQALRWALLQALPSGMQWQLLTSVSQDCVEHYNSDGQFESVSVFDVKTFLLK